MPNTPLVFADLFSYVCSTAMEDFSIPRIINTAVNLQVEPGHLTLLQQISILQKSKIFQT